MKGKATLRARLRRCRGHYPLISRTSGISRSWLSKYACGQRGKRPSYDLIQRLIAALDALEAERAKVGGRPRLAKARSKRAAFRTHGPGEAP